MRPIPLIIGPTAVGKTSASIRLAKILDAEIISVDSRQIYRDLTLGTAKPTAVERDGIPHHFVDELELPQVVSAGWFEREANERIRNILDRGKPVIAVGGSTLYIHALTKGLPLVPVVSPHILNELNEDVEAGALPALFAELSRVDPVFAATLDSSKSQRIVRGLSVHRATGQPLSSFFSSAKPAFEYNVIQLSRPREELYAAINLRVHQMMDSGLLDEAKRISSRGFDRSLSPLRTIGYTECFDYLSGSIETEDELVRVLQRNTRRYAKRQLTWMRRYGEDSHVPPDAADARLLLHATRQRQG